MTDKQINAAIAEACGWTELQNTTDGCYGLKSSTREYIRIPDYCNDLNAMAQAEKTLTNVSDAMEYSYLLEDMENMIEDWVPYRTLWSLSPRQRAEAFLRTLGLWKTDQSGERTEMEVQK